VLDQFHCRLRLIWFYNETESSCNDIGFMMQLKLPWPAEAAEGLR
jgi:hypothetical protein